MKKKLREILKPLYKSIWVKIAKFQYGGMFELKCGRKGVTFIMYLVLINIVHENMQHGNSLIVR